MRLPRSLPSALLPLRATHSSISTVSKAQSETRVLITFDKDFGELVFRRGKAASRGIVLFRLRKLSPDFVARRVAQILESTAEWEGHYAVVDEHSIRLRPLP